MKHLFRARTSKLTLEALPVGSLFLYDNLMYLKTENETEEGAIEAYQVGDGSFFWGTAFNAEQQRKLLVHQITQLTE